MEEQNLKKFNKLFPWFAGLSGDLLFWVAIDTLFLTVVKKFTASQIVSLTSISLIACILLQLPLLNIIKKIGNTKSVRLGSMFLLLSSILLTFGTNYIMIVIGKICYEIAFTFQNMINAVLRNNLEIQDKTNEYIKYRTNANTIYAVVTMIISFVASIMFNLNNYLPMIGCITSCLICFILSFYMVDYSNNDCIKITNNEKNKDNPRKISYSKIILIIIMSYGLFYPTVNSGQSNGKLFIQQELLKNFNVENTALIIGVILCASRIMRVISNISFNKIHKKYEDKVGFLLPFLLCLSLCLMVAGSLITYSIILKILIMSLGYIIILFIRDPFKVYIQDLALKNVEKEQQQSLLTILDLSRKVIRAIMSLSFTAILVSNPMIIVISILVGLSIIEILISVYLYKLIKKKHKAMSTDYIVELANMSNIDLILDLYSERMQWFKDNNIKQWNKYLINHPKSEFENAINNKNYYIVKNNGEIIAGFEVSTDSKDWKDDITPAYYIYKVVTKVGYKNVGDIIFEKCKEIAKLNGKKYLRLDCLKSNEKLNKIYESHNFKLIQYGYNKRYEYSLRELNIYE